MRKLILDLCGGTGAWAQPYQDNGYEVQTVDIHQDVRLIEWQTRPVHGILCAPPCTMFAASGARWRRTPAQMLDALSIVDACLRAVTIYQPKWWALENPIGKLRRYLGPPSHSFDPCDYGDPYRKKTLLWGNFTVPTKTPVRPRLKSPIHYMPPGPNRSANRAVTPAGFARAFHKANP